MVARDGIEPPPTFGASLSEVESHSPVMSCQQQPVGEYKFAERETPARPPRRKNDVPPRRMRIKRPPRDP
jgi:hypothetical protein